MKWPWSSSSSSVSRLHKENETLRNRVESLRAQLTKVRQQRDKAKDAIARSPVSFVDNEAWAARIVELQTQVGTLMAERNVAQHLHDTIRKELETVESNVLPQDLEWPLPSSDLRFRIGGQRSIWTFLRIGKQVSEDLRRLTQEAGRDVSEFTSVLDFGAGCGRVLRFLPPVFTKARIHAADVDPEGLAWSRDHLSFLAGSHVLPLEPPCAIPDASFDFIFAISVFTHLPLAIQQAWFAELRRIAKPGALLILTYMPDAAAAQFFTPDLALENVDGFSYYRTTPTDGLPDYYHVSYHTDAAIRRLAGEHFHVLSTHERAVNDHQSAIVCTV